MTRILDTLKALDEEQGDALERWFAEKRAQHAPHFYTSVDLRHSGLRLAPVSNQCLPADEGCQGGRIGAQDARTEADSRHILHATKRGEFRTGKAALGPDHDAPGRHARRVVESAQCLGDRRATAGLVAHQQPALGRPFTDQPRQVDRRAHLRDGEPLSLLRRLDRVGAQALDVHPFDRGVLRQDRLQHRDAELGRLLGDVVDARALDRRETEPHVGLAALRPRLLRHPGGSALLAAQRQLGLPFAIAAVEQQERRAIGAPHHMAQIMRLRLVQRGLAPRAQSSLDEKTRDGHPPMMPRRQPGGQPSCGARRWPRRCGPASACGR